MWKFPRSCQLVAGFHHQPSTLSDDARRLVTLIHICDTLCCQAKLGFNLTAVHQELDSGIIIDLAIDPSLIEQLRKRLPELVNGAGSLVN